MKTAVSQKRPRRRISLLPGVLCDASWVWPRDDLGVDICVSIKVMFSIYGGGPEGKKIIARGGSYAVFSIEIRSHRIGKPCDVTGAGDT
jgi:DNA gyrase inhibitor GyrI